MRSRCIRQDNIRPIPILLRHRRTRHNIFHDTRRDNRLRSSTSIPLRNTKAIRRTLESNITAQMPAHLDAIADCIAATLAVDNGAWRAGGTTRPPAYAGCIARVAGIGILAGVEGVISRSGRDLGVGCKVVGVCESEEGKGRYTELDAHFGPVV